MTDIQSVLITGGCGFIGANLVRFLRHRTPWRLRVVDDLRSGVRDFVPEGLAEVRIGDVSRPEVLDPALEGVDAVVHLASQTGVLPSVEDPVADFEGNTVATFRVLEGCRRRGISRVDLVIGSPRRMSRSAILWPRPMRPVSATARPLTWTSVPGKMPSPPR